MCALELCEITPTAKSRLFEDLKCKISVIWGFQMQNLGYLGIWNANFRLSGEVKCKISVIWQHTILLELHSMLLFCYIMTSYYSHTPHPPLWVYESFPRRNRFSWQLFDTFICVYMNGFHNHIVLSYYGVYYLGSICTLLLWFA